MLICVITSVVIHVIVAVILVLPVIADLFKSRYVPSKEVIEEEPKIVLRFEATPKKSVSVIPEPKALTGVKRRPRFAQTNIDQAKGVPEQADRIGDRDTLARSDTAAQAGAPDRASVKGEKRDYESIRSDRRDGELNNQSEAKQSDPIEPKSSVPPPLDRTLNAKPETVPDVTKGSEKRDLLEQRDKLAVVKSAEERAREFALAEKLKREKEVAESKKRQEELAKKEAEEREAERQRKAEAERRRLAELKKKSGFKSSVKASATVGSISRRGKASQNVKATPKGRYTAEVLKRVEKEWRRRCNERQDLLLPGSLTMGWFMNEDGTVSNLEVRNERNGGDIQKGITIQSINSVKLPSMPTSVRNELNGDPLYIQINFEF